MDAKHIKWESAEAEAWRRSFDYTNYLLVCVKMNVQPKSEVDYWKECQTMTSFSDWLANQP